MLARFSQDKNRMIALFLALFIGEISLQTLTELVIGSQQPLTANEMSPMDPKPTLYMKDQDGLVVNNVSSEADPWIVTASISNGVGALVNNLTCSFSGSLCVFENLAIDTMGEGYQLQFELTYPVSSIPAVVSDPFDVGSRPLSAKFTYLKTLNPMHENFTTVVTVWDDALDMPADASIIPVDIKCTVYILGVEGVDLMGTLEVSVVDGNATFSDLKIEDPVDYLAVALSEPFNVHPYPKTGIMRDASSAFTFTGSITDVDGVLNAFLRTISA